MSDVMNQPADTPKAELSNNEWRKEWLANAGPYLDIRVCGLDVLDRWRADEEKLTYLSDREKSVVEDAKTSLNKAIASAAEVDIEYPLDQQDMLMAENIGTILTSIKNNPPKPPESHLEDPKNYELWLLNNDHKDPPKGQQLTGGTEAQL